MTGALFASIALPVPLTSPFTYAVPPELAVSAEIGRRALVPFGPRLLTGYIVAIGDNPGDVPAGKIRPITDVTDDEQLFGAHMLALAEWVAEYYCCSVGEVLRAAMPAGTEISSRLRVRVTGRTPAPDDLDERADTVWRRAAETGSVLMRTLEREMPFTVAAAVRALERDGFVLVEREVKEKAVRPRTVRMVRLAGHPESVPARAREQRRVMDILAGQADAGMMLADLLERYGASRGVVNALVAAGLATYEEVPMTRLSRLLDQEPVESRHPLTPEQTACMAGIREERDAERRPVLIWGVTGSGKTRVYIEAVREALAAGKGAIILVPEISLTPQTTRFFSTVFPGRVAVLHSAMSPGERHDTWHLVHRGDRTVVIGPRSAVFAPVRDLGVIVVDEEHDGSYKQTDTAPRYHARDVAVVRARMLGIPAIIGSATPSLESWRNAHTGKYRLCHLTERVASRSLPEVVTVDMREERHAGNRSSLSRRLREELAYRLERGEKAIILINRRGFARGIQCRECGEVLTCPYCSIALTYHRSRGLALCHLCGHEQMVMEHCPECGSPELRYRGAGTQRVEAELAQIAGEDGIIRMDADTTRAHDAHYRLLEEFRTGPAPILLGTQMVAKGLDFPAVTLVGVLSADSALYIPDFRAGERAFQLVTQVAGRSGRGEVPGTVVLQTFTPGNYALEAAAAQDYEWFARRELVEREAVGFPPFSRLALVEFAGENAEAVSRDADTCADWLRGASPSGTDILGPAEAPIPRVRNNHRVHILARTENMVRLLPVLRAAAGSFGSHDVAVTVDVDPVDLM